jgi:hypothetical protein
MSPITNSSGGGPPTEARSHRQYPQNYLEITAILHSLVWEVEALPMIFQSF